MVTARVARSAGLRMSQPRQIYASTLTRKERGWGRARRRRPAPLLPVLTAVVTLAVLAAVGALGHIAV